MIRKFYVKGFMYAVTTDALGQIAPLSHRFWYARSETFGWIKQFVVRCHLTWK